MPNPSQAPPSESVASQFQAFAEKCRQFSPLYERLAMGIAEDPEVMTLAAQARRGERTPNLFLAAVQYLVLKGTRHPVAQFYKDGAAPLDDPYPDFRAFCLEHAAAIKALITTRMVQTNEIRRSALLLPAFVLVSREAQGRPLYLLEIGVAAGLNLLWDRYGYDYGNGLRSGDLDLNPIDVSRPDAGAARRIGHDSTTRCLTFIAAGARLSPIPLAVSTAGRGASSEALALSAGVDAHRCLC